MQFMLLNRDNGNANLLKVLNDVLRNGVFLQWSGEKELDITKKLLLSLAKQTMEFIRDSKHHLYAAHQDRNDTKRTVFILQDGKCRLSGKSHTTFSDMNVALLFVATIFEILNTQMLVKDIHKK